MGFTTAIILALLIAFGVIVYRANRPGPLNIFQIELADHRARFSKNRTTFLHKLNDTHWGGKVAKLEYLDHDDQMDLLCGIIRWCEITKGDRLVYEDIAWVVRNQYGQLEAVLRHVAERSVAMKLNPVDITVNDIYNWLLNYRP